MGVCRWRTRDVWWRVGLFLLFVLAAPTIGAAQTALDPRLIEFQSPDHLATDANGAPLIERYELTLFELGATVPVATVNLGKPSPAPDGLIHLDLLTILPTWPLPPGSTYEARVTALGPAGSAASGYSNPFAFSGPCAISTSAQSAVFGANGGTGSVGVSSGSACQWTAFSAAPWIALGSTGGTGAATLGYTVAPNTATSARTGSFTIGTTVVTISQAAEGCGFGVSATSASVGAAAGSYTLNVLSPNGCNWTLSSQASWLTILSLGGTMSKTIAYGVAANTSASPRTGTFTAAGISVTVTQAGTQSQTTSSPTTTSLSTSSTSSSTNTSSTSSTSSTPAPLPQVVDPQVLEFRASPDHYAVGADGQPMVRGYELMIVQLPARTSVLVAQLGKPTPDITGIIRVELNRYLVPTPPAGVTYEAGVNAIGAIGSASSELSNPFAFSACTPGVVPGTTSFAAFPGLSSATVTAPATCRWTTSSASAWITVGTGGSGNQTVSYSIAPNTSASSRTGSITIAGRTISITQDGVAAPAGGSSPAVPGTAQFIRSDTTSRGSWRGVYGAEGYVLAGDATALPLYAQATRTGSAGWVWNGAPSDLRSLERASGSGRIASTWYAESTFSIDLTISDGQRHAVSLYLLDYDSSSRTQTIEAIDLATGTVVDTRNAANYSNGTYYSWQVSGRIRFKITRTGGANATVSGVFFDPAGQPAPPPPAATFEASPATVAPGKPVTLSWSTTNAASVSIDQGVGTVGTSGTLTLSPTTTTTFTLTAQNAAGVVTRQRTVTVMPLPTAALTVTPSITAGQPATLSWSTSGAVTVAIDQGVGVVAGSGSRVVTPSTSTTWILTATNAVGSATATATVAVTAPPPTPGVSPAPVAARFVRTDTTTQGSWRGRYGVDGYAIAQDATSLPTYAQVARTGSADWVWSASPADARSLQRASATGRIASTWYAGAAFNIDVTIGDGRAHDVSLYLLDYDSPHRTETIEVIDPATGTVIDVRTASSFTNGAYYTWQVSGKVRFRITRTGGANAVVSGIFFGAP